MYYHPQCSDQLPMATFTCFPVSCPLAPGVASRAAVAVPQLLFPPALIFWGVMSAIVVSEMMFNPGMVLVDAAVVASLDNFRTYGRVRMWGSAGWGISASVIGTIIDRYGYWTAWGVHWVGSAVTLVVGILVVPFQLLRVAEVRAQGGDVVYEGGAGGGAGEPLLGEWGGSPSSKLQSPEAVETRNPGCVIAAARSLGDLAGALAEEEGRDGEEEEAMEEASFEAASGRTLAEILRAPRVALFFVLVFAWGAGFGVIDGYLFLWLEELHASQKLMGLTLTATCLAEVPIMFFSDQIIRAVGTDGCIHLVMAAFVLRLLAHSSLALWPTTWLILPVELLHGVTFGLAWACGTVRTAQLSPEGMRASMQGLFQATFMGVGKGAGALAAGLAYDWFGAAVMFRLAALTIAAFWAATTGLKLAMNRAAWLR